MSHNMTLGGLTAALKALAFDEDAKVQFDFCNYVPSHLGSYRGFYEDLAIGYCEEAGSDKDMLVSNFLKMLEEANGKTFQGYKGGDFGMGENTRLWVANYGRCSSTALVGIAAYKRWRVVLETKYIDLF